MNIEIAKSAGFCFGVNRAVQTVMELVKKPPANTAIYTIGNLIHNPQIIAQLEKGGIRSVGADEIDALFEQCDECHQIILIIRAHGIEKHTNERLLSYQKAKPAFHIIDCTCPYVKKIHHIVQENVKPGSALVVIGNRDHPEVKGILSYTQEPIYIFSNPEEISQSKIVEKELFMVAQTTLNTKVWNLCQKNILNLYTNTRIFDTICSVTENRQKEVAELSKKVDMMLVIGGRDSSNTNKLYNIAKENCENTFFIESVDDLPVFSLTPGLKIGIAAGASTPASIIKEVKTSMTEKTANIEEIKTTGAEPQNENFAELLEQSLKTLHTGEIVKGIITSMSASEVFVDLGTKTTGVISTDEFSDDASYNVEEHFKIGDEIEAIVIKVNDMDGVATLSRKRIERNNNWSIIVDAYHSGEILEGKIVDVVKGGLIIILHSVRVFIPATHSGVPKDGDLNALKGTMQKVKIIDLDESRNRAIASIRVVLREQRKAAEEEFWAGVEVGKRYTGTVKSLKNYGAFIDLGGVSGMVHITELSWTRIKHPSEVLKEGQQVEVYVKSFDREEGKISLGYKADEDDPWLKFMNQYKVNDVVTVKILSLLPFGAFAEIIPGADGLIHISQIADRKIAKPSEVLEIGQLVDAKIIEIDDENRKISLSIRALLEDDGYISNNDSEDAGKAEADEQPAADESTEA